MRDRFSDLTVLDYDPWVIMRSRREHKVDVVIVIDNGIAITLYAAIGPVVVDKRLRERKLSRAHGADLD